MLKVKGIVLQGEKEVWVGEEHLLIPSETKSNYSSDFENLT